MKRGIVAQVVVLLLPLFARSDQLHRSEPIPEGAIVKLEQLLREGMERESRSAVIKRRAYKNVARQGLDLAEQYPEAPNRFRVLGLVVEGQKRMMAMEGTDKNRQALFETCERLCDAPDRYAKERLEADLLLSDRDLSVRDATLEDRAEALSDLLDRYHGTSAEARSLLMGALIVQKLDAKELESQILYTLDEEFADDHEVIEFRRKYLKISRLDLVFSGKHKRIDGTELVFPADTMGHMSLMIFWSKDKPGIDNYLEDTKTALTNAPGRIDVFSFNVDSLPDGGESVLKEHGLDWTIVKLPDGRRSQAYRSYAQADPIAILVNDYGIAVTKPEIVHGRSAAVDSARISNDRYMAQLQSLFIGDFLITDPLDVSGLSAGDSAAAQYKVINDCFVEVPFRYRLTRAEVLANYETAANLCTELMGKSDPENARKLRDRRIIARLGMWNQDCEPKHLQSAVQEAKFALRSTLPPEAQVVSRFCLAKAALRVGEDQAEKIVKAFFDSCGGEDTASAVAAAAILSTDARSREMYESYRDVFLDKHAENPQFYAFTAFLRDRHIQYRILKANHHLRERRARGYIVGHGYPWPTNYLPEIELKNLDGSVFDIPKDTNGKMTYLLFVEPPDGTNDFPVTVDSHGRKRYGYIRQIMGYAGNLTKSYLNGDINFVAAFLTDDADHVKYLVKTNGWACQAVMVPGGLRNQIVRRLGILSADRVPNVFLLRRDGSIAWHASGLRYKNTFGFPFAYLLAMKVHVEVCEINRGYDALESGDWKTAEKAFTNPFPEERPQRFSWRSPRYHGKALAYAGLQEWTLALDAMDKSIDAHKLRHFRGYGRRSKSLEDWRKDAAKVTIKEPCDIICMLWKQKADILDELGRHDEAESLREKSVRPESMHRPYVYEQFHQKLQQWRITNKKEK